AAVSDLQRGAELHLGNGIVPRFCGGGPEQVPSRYREASPAARLPLGVPQLLVHGERDDIVPASMSTAYAAAARAGGDDATLELRPGDGHFEHIDPDSGAWETVTSWLTRFEA
ncbi:MAG: Lipase/esterase, partial [Solirubrobacterales bacterium]|nr:Lipase/esterase [Solirubrobacterales bacterium]